MNQDSQNQTPNTPNAPNPLPPTLQTDNSHKKLLWGLAILIFLMFAMIAAIIIKLSDNTKSNANTATNTAAQH